MIMLHINLKGITKCLSMVANISPTDPYPVDPPPPRSDLGNWVTRSKFNFFKHVRVTCSNMVANILPADNPGPRDGVRRSNSTFSENGHVAYQIKENHEHSNMVANILPADAL